MTKIMQGIVHGNTIELDQDVGLPDGQKVEVAVHVPPERAEPWGEGLRRCAGALAGIPGLDEDMARILQERKTANRQVARFLVTSGSHG
jgi:hypothetical protein